MKIRSLSPLTLLLALGVGWLAGQPGLGAPPAGAVLEAPTSENEAAETGAVDPVADEPLIGIASLTDATYVRAIRQSGGVPLVLPNTDGSPEAIDEYLEYDEINWYFRPAK